MNKIILMVFIIGCSKQSSFIIEKPSVESNETWTEVTCNECNGKGLVVYDANHELVKLNLAVTGEQYTCPICGGIGMLLEQGN